MAQVKFNENGDLVNVQTGQIFGNIKSGVKINSELAQVKSLDDLNVSLPEMPDDDNDDDDDDDDDQKENKIIPNTSNEQKKELPLNMDKGLTSFNTEKSKYEISHDTYFIIKFGLIVNKEDGRFIPIREDLVDDYRQSELHWVKFRMWNYREQLKWKQECTQYHTASHSQIINNQKLNQKKIRNLILDWSFGLYNDRLKLLHCNGVLSDESYVMFQGLYPSIANTIVNLMNAVLENNQ